MHDAVFGGTEEIGAAAEAVEHAGAHYAGTVGVGVDVDFDGRVHANHAQAADDFRRVRDLLGAEEQLGRVLVPLLVEALETVGGEADRGCGGEVQVSGVKEVQEGILEDLSPDLQVLEVGTAGLSYY